MDMHLFLAADLQAFVEAEAAEGKFPDGAEFVRDLIRRERARKNLRELIVEGMNSPIEGPMDDEFFDDLRLRYADPAGA